MELQQQKALVDFSFPFYGAGWEQANLEESRIYSSSFLF